uniref:BPTI/Kunitz inhibitor domain-containing protein n=1 Tax=Meloidogyne incognita TaxID=6306 RepID=A0A914NM41_MELIC
MSKFIILLIVLTTLIHLSEFKKAPKNPPKNDRCLEPKKVGIFCGFAGGPRWWYVAKEKVCKSFQYKGCGGNNNRFNSEKLCLKFCKGH